jgi:homoserine kinase type II
MEGTADTLETARAVCRDAREILGDLEDWWEADGFLLPEQAVHGDYGGDNLLFQGDEVVGILDFDFLAVRERIYDVAYALYWYFSRLESECEPADLSWKKAAHLVAHYNNATTHPLIPDEWDALPVEIARVPLYWIAEASFARDPAATLCARAGSVRFSHWVMDNLDEIADTLAE